MGRLNSSCDASVASTSSGSDDAVASLTRVQQARLAKYRSALSPLKKYHVGPGLGEGSFGVVQRVTDRKTGKQYACKHISLYQGDERDTAYIREEILREVDAMCELEHPNIAGLVEYHETESAVYIVMELLGGEELCEALHERGSLPEEDARNLIRQLFEAVRYLHSQGVVHRDLKLENCILVDEGDLSSIKIVDFGLACRVGSKVQAPRMSMCCGSPAFVAPEVLRAGIDNPHRTCYGQECDVWSLGVMLFAMLSGYMPFDGQTDHDVLKLVLARSFDFNDPVWELISPSARQLISGLLEADPNARLTIDEALKHPWLADC
mmetsp:Transcript_14173/g.36374  ORF Transcript_14173/g.36374 Transcript_14173/m.36374 type:complete len:322 (+) Transcript_14173:123-1088(+)